MRKLSLLTLNYHHNPPTNTLFVNLEGVQKVSFAWLYTEYLCFYLHVALCFNEEIDVCEYRKGICDLCLVPLQDTTGHPTKKQLCTAFYMNTGAR